MSTVRSAYCALECKIQGRRRPPTHVKMYAISCRAAYRSDAYPVCSRCALGNLMLGVQKLCGVYLTAFAAAHQSKNGSCQHNNQACVGYHAGCLRRSIRMRDMVAKNMRYRVADSMYCAIRC